MTAIQTNPQPIVGPWEQGFTLDVHTVSSEFLGYDGQGHAIYDTVRSEIGELLFQCKYRGDRAACGIVARAAGELVRARMIAADVVVPVPPSRARSFQPLASIAATLAEELGITYDDTSLRKVKETPELKSVSEMAKREEALQDAFDVQGDALRGRAILLLDDLYRSGASMRAAARILRSTGGVAAITALALTRTRTRL